MAIIQPKSRARALVAIGPAPPLHVKITFTSIFKDGTNIFNNKITNNIERVWFLETNF
jgi:hypothetical protein